MTFAALGVAGSRVVSYPPSEFSNENIRQNKEAGDQLAIWVWNLWILEITKSPKCHGTTGLHYFGCLDPELIHFEPMGLPRIS